MNNTMDITMKPQSDDNIQSKVEAIIAEMQRSGIDQNPVECLRMLQTKRSCARCLEITDLAADNSGATNFILVDRNNLLATGFEELRKILKIV